MAGFANDVVYANNGDFSVAGSSKGQLANGLLTNGQMWIGTTAVNAGGTHINVGTLTSPDASITFGFSTPNITATVAGGTSVVTKLSDDVGTVASPSAGIIQLPGHVNNTGGKFSTTVAGSSLISINPMSSFRWIVDPLGFNGTHTTLTSALASASAGDTIGIVAGGASGGTVLTENVTLKAGVSIYGMGDGPTPTVTIKGKLTFSTAGTSTITNVRLQTNADYFLVVAGSAATIVNLEDCYLNPSDANGINFTTSNVAAEINVHKCIINANTNRTAHIMTSTGTIYYTYVERDGTESTVVSTNSAGLVWAKFSEFSFPFSASSTGSFVFNHVKMAIASTCIAVNGTGAGSDFRLCAIDGGNNPAITVGAGALALVYECALRSGGVATMTGAGTVEYAGLATTTAAGALTVTTQTGRPFFPGNIVMQPAGTGGTATSNTMTTYEEGTWIPTLVGASTAGSTTYSVQTGYYTKIGNQVTVWGKIQISAATGTGDATIGALPFTIKNQTNFDIAGPMILSSSTWAWPAGKTQVSVNGTLNTTTATIAGTATGTTLSNTQMANSAATFRFSLTYQV